MKIVTLILTTLLTYLISSNNLSVCVGPLVSTRMLNEKNAPIFAYFSYIVGLLLQSKHMVHISVSGTFLDISLAITLIIVFIGEVFRVPVSLMYILSTSIMTYGLVVSSNYKLIYAVSYWILSSFIIFILCPPILKILHYVGSRRPTVGASVYRFVSYITSFLLCMSFGANNIGYLWMITGGDYTSLIPILISSMLGTFITGRRTRNKLAGVYALTLTGCLVVTTLSYAVAQIATFIGIPVSFSVLLVCSLVGISYGYSIRIIDYKYVKKALTVLYLSIPLSFTLTLLTLSIIH